MLVLPDRFWAKTVEGSVPADRPDLGPCLEWSAAVCPKGYGSFNFRRDMTKRAHVLAWKAERGEVPEGLELSHLCDNRKCVRVKHMVAETHGENIRRKKRSEECPQGHTDWIFFKNNRRECRPCSNDRRKRYPRNYRR